MPADSVVVTADADREFAFARTGRFAGRIADGLKGDRADLHAEVIETLAASPT